MTQYEHVLIVASSSQLPFAPITLLRQTFIHIQSPQEIRSRGIVNPVYLFDDLRAVIQFMNHHETPRPECLIIEPKAMKVALGHYGL